MEKPKCPKCGLPMDGPDHLYRHIIGAQTTPKYAPIFEDIFGGLFGPRPQNDKRNEGQSGGQ